MKNFSQEKRISNKNWTVDENKELNLYLRNFKLTIDQEKMINEQIQNIDIAETFISSFRQLQQSEKTWENLQKIISENKNSNSTLKQSTDKDFLQLSEEILQLNSGDFLKQGYFFKTFSLVQEVLNNLSVMAQIQNKFSDDPELTCNDLVYLSHGVKYNFKYYPRAVQLLSVVLLYNKNQQKGRLAQVYTGEGKTLIVGMLAILICKKKQQNVDIITSSSVLAKRDSLNYASFYEYFNLTSSHNIREENQGGSGTQKCYKCQIVYGDAHSFQADFLRHTYEEQGTMGTREQQFAIVDEVDSMLIDGHSNKTIISSPTPGMLDLQKVLSIIWDEVGKVANNLSINDQVQFVTGNLYCCLDKQSFLEQVLQEQLNNYFAHIIPDYRLQYCRQMAKVWLENALLASKFELKKQYAIEKDKVRIIDYQNTGVIQSNNTQWEQGLHQFIQLKHNLKVTPLTIASNFISNVTFFKLYKNKLLGLTGTLGSKNTLQLLEKQYNLDFIFIPPFRTRSIIEEQGLSLKNKDKWLSEIGRVVFDKINQNRAVLIINKTIQEVEKIENILNRSNCKSFIYFDDKQQLPEKIYSKQVIIATNLAGRGADLITDDQLEKSGGLHVILTFLPQNIRVQDQGFGRTCRQGKKGSAQLIVNFQESIYTIPGEDFDYISHVIECQKQMNKQEVTEIEVLKCLRDKNEKFYISQMEEQMKKLEYEDDCFKLFSRIAKSKAKKDTATFKSLEEIWGIYLAENKENGLKIEDIPILLQNSLNKNPCYAIQEAYEQNDGNIIREATKHNEDAYLYYHQSLFEIKEQNYEKAEELLLKSKNLFQNKEEIEQTYVYARQLNQQFKEKEDKLPGLSIFENFSSQDEERNEKIQRKIFQKQQIIKKEKKRLCQNQKENESQDQQQQETQKEQQKETQNDHQQSSGNQKQQQRENQKETQSNYNSSDQNFKQNCSSNYSKKDSSVSQEINSTTTRSKFTQVYLQSIETLLNAIKTRVKGQPLQVDLTPIRDILDVQPEEEEDITNGINDNPYPVVATVPDGGPSLKDRLLLFLVGALQVSIGGACIVFGGGGLYFPMVTTLIFEGVLDIWQSVMEKSKINWTDYGTKKLISYSLAAVFQGCSLLEKLSKGTKIGNIIVQNLPFRQYLKLASPCVQGVFKLINYLDDKEKTQLKKIQQILDLISKAALQFLNINTIKQKTKEILRSSQFQNIDQKTAQEIEDVVEQSIVETQQSNKTFQETFLENGTKYIKIFISRIKSIQKESKDVNLIFQTHCAEKLNSVQNQFTELKDFQANLNKDLDFFQKKTIELIDQDLDIHFLYFNQDISQYKTFKVFLNSQDFQVHRIINNIFTSRKQKVFKECENLDLSSKEQQEIFYENQIRPLIQEFQQMYIPIFLTHLNQDQQSIEIENWRNRLKIKIQALNYEEKQQEDTKQLQEEIEEFQEVQEYIEQKKQMLANVFQDLKNRNFFNQDQQKLPEKVISEYDKFLEKNVEKQVVRRFLSEVIRKLFQQAELSKKNGGNFVSNQVKAAVKGEVLSKILDHIQDFKFKEKQNSIYQSQNGE